MGDYTSPNPLYSYPGWPAWVPSTSLMTLPMGGLGVAEGGGGLGASRLMGPTEVLHLGKLYTYRTYSLVPLVEGAEFGGFFSRNTAWGNHRSTRDILQPPGTVRSLYQAGTAEPYTGNAAGYRGRNVYTTSLTFTPKRAGLTVAQAKAAALNILNSMRADFADDQSMKIFEGNLYERGVSDTVVEAPSILDRARAVITGQDPAEAVRERVAEAQASDQRMLYFKIGAAMTFALGVFLATRKGSAKLEGRAFTAATIAAPLVGGRRNGRKRRARNGGRAQNAIMQLLPVDGSKVRLTDLARQAPFRGIHFNLIMSAARALKKAGHVTFDGDLIGLNR